MFHKAHAALGFAGFKRKSVVGKRSKDVIQLVFSEMKGRMKAPKKIQFEHLRFRVSAVCDLRFSVKISHSLDIVIRSRRAEKWTIHVRVETINIFLHISPPFRSAVQWTSCCEDSASISSLVFAPHYTTCVVVFTFLCLFMHDFPLFFSPARSLFNSSRKKSLRLNLRWSVN